MHERRFTDRERGGISVETREDGQAQAIVGYGAVYYDGTRATEYRLWGNIYERIMPGAFDRALGKKGEAAHDVRGLFNHNPSQVLGRTRSKTMTLASDDTGLRYRIEVGDTTIGRDVVQHVKRGDVTGSSFMFRVVDQEWLEEDGGDRKVRQIKDVELFDTGPVTFPAYEATTAEAAADDRELTEARASYQAWQEEKEQRAARAAELDKRIAGIAE